MLFSSYGLKIGKFNVVQLIISNTQFVKKVYLNFFTFVENKNEIKIKVKKC